MNERKMIFEVLGGDDKTPQEEAMDMAKPNPTKPTKPQGSGRSMIGGAIAYDAAKQVGRTVTSNIGNWTGNSHLQAQIDVGNKMLNYAARYLAVPTLSGAIATTVSIGIEEGFNLVNYKKERKWEAADNRRQARRTGLALNRNI